MAIYSPESLPECPQRVPEATQEISIRLWRFEGLEEEKVLCLDIKNKGQDLRRAKGETPR